MITSDFNIYLPSLLNINDKMKPVSIFTVFYGQSMRVSSHKFVVLGKYYKRIFKLKSGTTCKIIK